ncbi:hypothetical protein P4O66_015969 [Electrophorus voltai]|uniref:IGFBP N-terminal domain-containing protein n=1 Tax=Electrophorus voltai TaxID=2609070 RepID=A0AAD8YWF3_9TELE|nr:hypothetical protein P4O66_015969 [Electrophorus voltai]
MYLKCLVISQVLLVLVLENSWALSCIACNYFNCLAVSDCPGKKVLDSCGCCHECAKQKNEVCGGPYDVYGTCDKGLQCAGNILKGICVGHSSTHTHKKKKRAKRRRHRGRKHGVHSIRTQTAPRREERSGDAIITQGGASEPGDLFK